MDNWESVFFKDAGSEILPMLQQIVPHPCTKWTQLEGGCLSVFKEKEHMKLGEESAGEEQRGRNGDRYLIKT